MHLLQDYKTDITSFSFQFYSTWMLAEDKIDLRFVKNDHTMVS